MAGILSSLRNTVIAGFVLAFLLELMYLNSGGTFDTTFLGLFVPLAARFERHYVDWSALLFQLCANPKYAEYS